ncbi:MAG: cyclopropane-fatty-acyl-phospholipid synthase family protein, partial [Gammaproteobacteria bacterium]|nr:cyclopropane-fatty-acyl-phospholipid synthase family protein [Gammaproteobacteria bacterium]
MNSVNPSVVKTSDNSGWLGNFAKSQLRKRLQQMPRGYLLIEDGDDLFSFGDPEDRAGIKAKIVIKDASAYRDIAFGGSIGGAEAYMLDKWTTPNLLDVVRLMSINIDFLNQMDDAKPLLQRIGDKLFHWLKRNTEKQARQNIANHYDLSNDFFALFLDPEMMYSSAIFPHPNANLDEAALHKLDVICRKLDLQPSDHLLEIGTGWGGLAVYAAKNYGCRVTTTTISKEQFDAARERIQAEGLEQQIEVLFEDYRNLTGRFDKLVSIEMIEAV